MEAVEERSYGKLTFVDKEGKRGIDYTINKAIVIIGRSGPGGTPTVLHRACYALANVASCPLSVWHQRMGAL